jgi:hypothetical protein
MEDRIMQYKSPAVLDIVEQMRDKYRQEYQRDYGSDKLKPKWRIS